MDEKPEKRKFFVKILTFLLLTLAAGILVYTFVFIQTHHNWNSFWPMSPECKIRTTSRGPLYC